MTLNGSTRLFRAICALFFTIFCLSISATAQSVEKIKSDSSGHWVIDGHEIYIEMPCEISRSSLLPTKVCRQPYIVIARQRAVGDNTLLSSALYFNLVAQKISIGDKWMFDGNDDPMRRISISDMAMGPQRSQELFALLASEPNTPLKFKTRSDQSTPIKARTVVLSDFETSSSEIIGAIHQRYDLEEESARRSMLFGLLFLGALLAFALWLARFLLKRGQIGLQIAKQKIEMKRVARIADDEAIRQTVRSSVQKVDDSELEVLRSQIKIALDSGDTETAEKLLNILKKSGK